MAENRRQEMGDRVRRNQISRIWPGLFYPGYKKIDKNGVDVSPWTHLFLQKSGSVSPVLGPDREDVASSLELTFFHYKQHVSHHQP